MKKNKHFFVFLLVVFAAGRLSIVNAQQIVQGIPWTGAPGITLTVDQIMAMEVPQVGPVRLKEQREHDVELHKRPNPEAPAIAAYPASAGSMLRGGSNTTAATQTIGAGWTGVTFATSGGWVPPDCNGDVGPTQVLTCANTRIQVYSKTGVLGALNSDLNTFFASVRGSSGISDTHIRYDRLTQRWFVVTINVANSNNVVCIAVSSGPTITGAASFTFYSFAMNVVSPAGNNGQFFDYPTLGVDANALYIGGNCFGGNFVGSIMFVVRKSSVTGGGPIVATAFRNLATSSTGIYTPQGVQNDDPNATEGYFIGSDAGVFSKLNIIRISNPGGAPTATALSLTVPTTNNPIGQVSSGTTNKLDGLDDRPFAAMMMKNKLTGISSLWTAQNIEVNASGVATSGGGRNGSRWYEIGNMSTTPSLIESGTLYDPATSNMRGYWIPSIAMSGQGHAVLGSSTAAANKFADAQVAGRYNCDALGTLQASVLATASTTTYARQSGTQRWGDFSQTIVDPTDNMTMWTFQEFCDAANDWAVRVTKLLAPPPPPTAVLTPLPNVTCGATSASVSIVATSQPNCTGFFDPGADAGGPGFANHISASVTGGITVTSITFVDAAHVNLVLNTSAAVPGTYVITITNPDGQTTTINITISSNSPNAGVVSGTSPLCATATATYTSSGDAGGSWSSSSTAIATVNSSTGVVTALSAGTTNIIYTVTGCSNTASAFKTLTVTPNGNAGVVSGASPLCIGTTSTFSSNGDGGGTWSSSSSAIATVNSSTGVVTAVAAGTTNIIYTVNSGCSPVSAFKTLTVSPNVNAGTVSGTSTLCIGVTTTYSTTGSGGSWSSSNSTIATVNSSTGVVTPISAGTTNIIYTVSSGCGSPVTALKTLTVSPNANAGTVSGTSPLCIGATTTYTTTGSGGSWSSSNAGIATVNSSTGVVTPISAGTTNIIYIVSSGCNSPVSSFNVLTVSPNANAGTVSGTSPLCIGATTTYTTTGSGGNWSSSNSTIATVNSSTGVVTPISAGTTNIIYTVSSGCGSPVSAFQTLTVNPNVNAGIVSGTSPLCIGTTTTYTTTGSGGSWSSSNTTIATVNSSTGVVTAASAGTANIIYTVSSGCGSPVSAFQTLTVNPNVNAGIVSGTSPLCIGTTTTYTTTGSGGSWSSSNTTIATANSSTGVVTPVAAGTTNIIYSVSSGCNSPASSFSTLTVNPNANAGTVSGTSPLCIGATTTYTTTGSGGNWSSSNPAIATVNSSTGVVTSVSAGTTNIIYTVSIGCNSPVTSLKMLTVGPNANAGTVSGTSPLCIGMTAFYISNGDVGGTWSSSNTLIASVNSSTGIVTALAAGTTTITYAVSNGCNSVSAFKILTVSPNANAGTVSGTSPLCIGATASYISNGDAGGTWSSSSAGIAIVNSSTGLVTSVSVGTTNIIYIVNSGCNSPVSALKTLTVSPNANAGTVSGTSPLCIGATASYISNGDAGGTWSSSNAGIATVNSSTGLVTSVSAGTANIIYTVSSGCNSPVSSFKVLTVGSNANAGNVSGNSPLCINATATYSSSGDAGGTWSSSSTAIAIVNSSTGVVTALASGTTNIIYSVSNGCSSVSSYNTLTVNPNANAGTASGISPLCIGQTTTYTTTGSGGSWSSSTSSVATVDPSTGVVTPLTAGTALIIYTVSGGCNSPVSSFVRLVVNPDATAGILSGTSPLCSGATSTYSTNGNAGGVWSSSNTAVAIVNSSTGVVTGITSGTTTIIYTVNSGCNSPASTGQSLTVTNCSSALNLTLFIQGYYRHMGSATPMDNLGAGGCLFINGLSADPLNVDSVIVTLMDPVSHNVVESRTGILKTNGSLSVIFSGSVVGNSYYIRINHRNSISTWSAAPVLMAAVTTYNFSTGSAQAFGNNMVLIDGKWAIYNGDIDQNGVIENSDYSVIDFDVYFQNGGYIVSDLTGDGIVDSSDYSVIDYNVYFGIGTASPW